MTTLTHELTAADVMTPTFVTAEPPDTLGEVAEKLAEHDAGSALVTEYGHLVGILTSRDVVRALAARVHPSEARVREWMTTPPEVTSPETAAADTVRTMFAGGFHHLPVVRAGRPIGVVGLRAAAAAADPIGLGLRCTLHAATGTDADCPGATCGLWDEQVGRCALAPVEDVVGRHSELAAYLLQIRGDLEAARDVPGSAM